MWSKPRAEAEGEGAAAARPAKTTGDTEADGHLIGASSFDEMDFDQADFDDKAASLKTLFGTLYDSVVALKDIKWLNTAKTAAMKLLRGVNDARANEAAQTDFEVNRPGEPNRSRRQNPVVLGGRPGRKASSKRKRSAPPAVGADVRDEADPLVAAAARGPKSRSKGRSLANKLEAAPEGNTTTGNRRRVVETEAYQVNTAAPTAVAVAKKRRMKITAKANEALDAAAALAVVGAVAATSEKVRAEGKRAVKPPTHNPAEGY